MNKSFAKGLIALLRLPYWLMTGGLALLTAFAITKQVFDPLLILLIFFSMALITSAGFSLNDYFDSESDSVIKPQRPIPSGVLSLKQAVVVSGFLFVLGLSLALLISPLSFVILLIDSVLLIFYSAVIKRKSGFAANILIGLLVGTAFLYGEATSPNFQSVSLISMSLYPICLGQIGGGILRDVLSLEGDSKVGYSTLPKKIGVKNSVSISTIFFAIAAIGAPLPYLLGFFSVYYLVPILMWGIVLIYSSIRLLIEPATVQNVRKYERLITMIMILLILSLILEAFIH